MSSMDNKVLAMPSPLPLSLPTFYACYASCVKFGFSGQCLKQQVADFDVKTQRVSKGAKV
ncbi:MAG: hypothetical protein LBT94_06345 [Prevotellaceae bacterium]|jgi:hypothetical protein|nr:hypothetical protein [Prevotellaceae bacterium]